MLQYRGRRNNRQRSKINSGLLIFFSFVFGSAILFVVHIDIGLGWVSFICAKEGFRGCRFFIFVPNLLVVVFDFESLCCFSQFFRVIV